jgi:hypothetical protein
MGNPRGRAAVVRRTRSGGDPRWRTLRALLASADMSPHDPRTGPTRARRVLRSLRRLWEPATDADRSARRRRSLHVCPRCAADSVNPAAAEPVDDETWQITLRCGGCADTRDVRINDAEAAGFDRDLDRGCAVIARALEAIERERMSGWAEAFIGALDRGLLDAEDFALS